MAGPPFGPCKPRPANQTDGNVEGCQVCGGCTTRRVARRWLTKSSVEFVGPRAQGTLTARGAGSQAGVRLGSMGRATAAQTGRGSIIRHQRLSSDPLGALAGPQFTRY
eukprot:363340-Chlamydomonas_euryale.AAC.3